VAYERPFEINVNDITLAKLDKDIAELTDTINEEANEYYENRVLGYERLRHIMVYIGIHPKLYGSCCVGLAIKNSDIDVTIKEQVLQYFFPNAEGTLTQVLQLFEYLQSYFAHFGWILSVKVISSATIPIIKLTIDNRLPFVPFLPGHPLNQSVPHCGLVQIDLTVETTDPSRKHLGVVSTIQTKEWLSSIPTLQAIAIVLKDLLAAHLLNETYYGGINTFTLLVMLVAVIKK
jgi:DNA polymerase sigma